MKHLGTIELTTERLILRKLTLADAEVAFINWTSNDEVTKYLTWKSHKTVQETKQLFRYWEKEYTKEEFYQWVIVPKNLNEAIGTISVVEYNNNSKMMSIGYCIGQNWWGSGYATESLNVVIKFLFEKVGVNRIQATHDIDNPKSGDVMKRCDMEFEGILRQAYISNQGFADMAMYSILAKDYFEKLMSVHKDVQ